MPSLIFIIANLFQTGALEGQIYRKTQTLLSISEQNLLDCTLKYKNFGCKYGRASNAYRYIIHNKGIDLNSTYPWKGKKSWLCHYKKLGTNPIVRGIMTLPSRNETALAAALATVGPIAVAIDARSNKFRFYKQGIFNESSCSSTAVNREALVVGYEGSYWIIKNSWGIHWGQRGYIYMARNGRNLCGVATRALYPVV